MRFRIHHVFRAFWPIATFMIAYGAVGETIADTADRVDWATGADFRQQLAQPVDVLWAGNPLRAALQGLAEAQRVAILVDRRIDPGRKLDLTIQNAPLQSALQTIADRCGLGVSRLGDVVYFGPASCAARLRPIEAALQQRVRQLPKPIQRKFSRSKALAWDDLATPRDLLAGLARQNGLEISGLDRVPHDLWAAADLPPLSLVDRLTLIAAQFDLTLTVDDDGTHLELVPVPDDLPEATKPFAGITPPRHRPKRPAVNIERLRIQRISVQNEQLGPVLRQLADRLGLELKIDEKALQAAGVSLDQRITMTAENVSVDELFQKVLKSTGLEAHRRRKVLEIVPAK